MARKRRVLRTGMMYHVMGRGNERKVIFKDDTDRELFLKVWEEGLEKYEGICHAWCLMDNHYHTMVETLLPNLSEMMRWIGTTYTVRFNRKYGRVGHLFQGRYRAEVVSDESYTKRLILYIHMNPVRRKKKNQERYYVGGMEELLNYRWSSHRGYLRLDSEYAKGFELVRRKYWKDVRSYQKEIGWELNNRENLNFREEVRGGFVLGGEGFQRTMESYLAKQEGESVLISKRMELERRKSEVEKLWKSEQEKKWQIWVRVRYGKESKASLGRVYGYASGSGITRVIELVKKEIAQNKESSQKDKKYGEQIKKC